VDGVCVGVDVGVGVLLSLPTKVHPMFLLSSLYFIYKLPSSEPNTEPIIPNTDLSGSPSWWNASSHFYGVNGTSTSYAELE
jgi:hypothetical protein